MCIIAIKPKGKKMFSDELIATMFKNNPDGAGYMYHDGKKVVIRKGFMDVVKLLNDLDSRDLTNTNVVMHFRIGTSGFYDELNCHPFPIYQKNATRCKTDIGLAHNGILHDYTPMKGSPINDTQLFIQTVLRRLKKGFQKDSEKVMLINELIGTNKLALLDEDNELTLIGDFIEDEGYIYSNFSYKPRKPLKKAVKPQISIWEDSDETGFWKDWDLRH